MARIADLLGQGTTVSFEFFPPKDEGAEATLRKAILDVASMAPAFVSVTYGALGSTRDRTRDLVVELNGDHPFPVMPHLTCVGHTVADIEELLDAYADAGITNILALGGDAPADGSDPGGDFSHAAQLVEVVRAHRGDFCIGVAAHPEGHPRSPDRATDRRYLADKLALADFAMTQFFFTADLYGQLCNDLADLGCTKPVVPGVMPISSVAGIRRMAAMNATEIPEWLDARLDDVAHEPAEVRALGEQVAIELAGALLDLGAPGLHLYTMNRADSVRRIWESLSL